MANSSRHSSQIGDGDETMVTAVEVQPTGPRATGHETVETQPIGSQTIDEQEGNSRLPNPLALLTQQQVLAEVAIFVEQKGLSKHMRLFKTAALVAQSSSPSEYDLINELKLAHPADYEGVRLLEEEELDALRDEPLKRFKHPRELYWTIVLCSVGAIVQ
ncbi:hypothetical protein MMC07_004276 [Pseudocyphellaria aurata]|nr:hypothetical protein [Pseudocyphellaria aurata]